MIRREKAKVLSQLPDKTRADLHVEISNREEYELAATDLAEYLRRYTECTDFDIRRKMRMKALVKFMTLRSLAAKGKVRQAIDFVRVFLSSGKPLILFCSLHEIVDSLCKEFPGAVPEEKEELYRRMREHGFDHLFTINTMTLGATVKELKANNDDILPDWLEGVIQIYEQPSIRVAKSRK